MVVLERTVTFALVFSILPAKTVVDGFQGWCPGRAIVNLTEESRDTTTIRIYNVSCFTVSILFMGATLIVYSVVPELKNLQGWTIRSYLASYISCMVVLTTFVASNLVSNNYSAGEYFTGLVSMYFGLARLMWLNVMSFDIWRMVREFQPRQDNNTRTQLQRTRYKHYSIFVWGTSALLLVFGPCFLILIDLTTGMAVATSERLPLICLIVGSLIPNLYFFISTALTIRRQKKETGGLVNGSNKHHQRKNQEWFNLYLKLFIIMGCSLIMWVVAITWANLIFLSIVFVLEGLQSVSIFLIFVWKEDIKRSFRQQFVGMMGLRTRLSSLLRFPSPHSQNLQICR